MVGDDVEAGLFVLWCVWVAVEFGDVDLELCVVAVLFEPLLAGAGDGVVAVCAVASGATRGCMLGVVVEWV